MPQQLTPEPSMNNDETRHAVLAELDATTEECKAIPRMMERRNHAITRAIMAGVLSADVAERAEIAHMTALRVYHSNVDKLREKIDE